MEYLVACSYHIELAWTSALREKFSIDQSSENKKSSTLDQKGKWIFKDLVFEVIHFEDNHGNYSRESA